MRSSLAGAAGALLLVAACREAPAPSPALPAVRFTDVAAQAGIDFRYTFGDSTYVNIIESSGSGVTFFDADNDGDQDLYLLNGTYLPGISTPDGVRFRNSRDRFYLNNGDGTFRDATLQSGLGDTHWSMAATPIDYDRDGDQDLYLLNYGANVLFRNNGDGAFSDVTATTRLAGPARLNGFEKWSIGAILWDYDADGDADLLVANFLAFDPSIVATPDPSVMPHPGQYRGQATMLYRQDGDHYTDVTREQGLYFPDSKAMGVAVFDYDLDGDLDLFQANDHQLNFLFRNDGGRLREVGRQTGVAANDEGKGTGSMHPSIGDVDGDGLPDVLVSDLEHGALYRNRGDGTFEDITSRSGLSKLFGGLGAWASLFLDYDNDGDLDIFSANGGADELISQLPLLIENDGKGHFRNAGPALGTYFRMPRSGRGAAIADYDNDGDPDIMVSHIEPPGSPSLLRNDGGNRNHWLGVALVGRGPASTTGAVVEAVVAGRRILRVMQPASSYLSTSDPRLLFGLGKANRVDRLIVRWPGGPTQTFTNIAAGRYVTITQGEGLVTDSRRPQ